MELLLFGYGSLISPVSLVSKIQNPDTLSEVYETPGEPFITESEVEAWREFEGKVQRTPAKLRGFRRYYSKESIRGGAVLEAVRTGNSDDFINGMLVHDLDQEQYDNIVSTEPGYQRLTLTDPNIRFYDPADADKYADDPVEIFVKDAAPTDLSVDVRRNDVYHGRITEGIRLVEQEYDETIAETFLEDFRQSTYELAYSPARPSEFVTVAENDRRRQSSET